MKHLIHVASAAPVQVGHLFFDTRTGESHIITRLPQSGRSPYIGYTVGAEYRDIHMDNAGIVYSHPHRISVYDGDEVEFGDLTFKVKFERDDDTDASWERGDGYGIISDNTDRPKHPAERVIGHTEYGRRRLYDISGSMKKALAEGWDAPPYTGTKGERAARAVEADYKYHDEWLRDLWEFVGVTITCVETGAEDSCWGFETYKDYHMEAAWEMIESLAQQQKEALELAEETAKAEVIAHAAHTTKLQAIADFLWADLEQAYDGFGQEQEVTEQRKADFNELIASSGVQV